MNYHTIQMTSSRKAHRLVKYIQNKHTELGIEAVLKIYEANFVENKVIADTDVLVGITNELGLDEKKIRDYLYIVLVDVFCKGAVYLWYDRLAAYAYGGYAEGQNLYGGWWLPE